MLRKTNVEPLQGQLKYLSNLEYLPIKGLSNVRSFVILATLTYLLRAKLNLTLGLNIFKLQDTLFTIRWVGLTAHVN